MSIIGNTLFIRAEMSDIHSKMDTTAIDHIQDGDLIITELTTRFKLRNVEGLYG